MASKEQKAREAGIELGRSNDYRTPCPKCSPLRKKKKDPCLHVTVTSSEITFFCHHCQDFKGTFSDDDEGHGQAGRPSSRYPTARPRTGHPAARRWW